MPEEESQVSSSSLSKDIGSAMGPTGVLIIVFAIFLVLYEVAYWLFKGTWPGLDVVFLLEKMNAINVIYWLYMPQEWIGLSKVCRYIFELPLAVFCSVLGGLICWIGFKIEDWKY